MVIMNTTMPLCILPLCLVTTNDNLFMVYCWNNVGSDVFLGDISLVGQLEKDAVLTAHKDAVKGLEAMKLLLEYCAIFDIKDKVGELYRSSCLLQRFLSPTTFPVSYVSCLLYDVK